MKTEAKHPGGVTVVRAGSQLTLENAHELQKIIRSVAPGLPSRVVVDMNDTRVLDSTGVGAIVSSMRYVRHLKGGFAVSNLSPEIQHVFHMMNLHHILEVYDTVELASEHVTSQRPSEL